MKKGTKKLLSAPAAEISRDDDAAMRLAFDVAREAVAAGNHPFGAVLVDAAGRVLLAQGNDRRSGDPTAHAERVLAARACLALPEEVRAAATLVSSAEPCAMCAGAIYWVGIRRVVYGLSETRLRALTGAHPENPTLDLPCRTVFAAGQVPTEVVGPLHEDEAEALHAGRWASDAAAPSIRTPPSKAEADSCNPENAPPSRPAT